MEIVENNQKKTYERLQGKRAYKGLAPGLMMLVLSITHTHTHTRTGARGREQMRVLNKEKREIETLLEQLSESLVVG
jgi:hypothetical protein